MIKLTLVTVVFNDVDSLKRTIASVDLRVNESNARYIEHLIIDGRSTDNTLVYLNEISAVRPVDTVVISESDFGIYDAMNKGIMYSRGLCLLFLNAGDEIHHDCNLSDILDDIDDSLNCPKEAGLAYASIMKLGSVDYVVKPRMVLASKPRMPAIHQAIVYKRASLILVPFDTTYRICGDYDNVSKIVKRVGFFRPIPRMFAIFYAGGISTQKPFLLIKESFRVSSGQYQLNFAKKIYVFLRLIMSVTIFQLIYHWEFSLKRRTLVN